MKVRFSRHAIRRLKQRFPLTIHQLIEVIDRGLSQQSWKSVQDNCRAIDGTVQGQAVRIVFMQGLLGCITIVTVMWRHEMSV